MRLASFKDALGDTRVGVALARPGGDVVVDVQRAYTRHLAASGEARPEALAAARAPTDMRLLLESGAASMNAVRQSLAIATVALARPEREAEWRKVGLVHDVEAVRFLPPVPRPGKIMSCGANYPEHIEETAGFGANAGKPEAQRAAPRPKGATPPAWPCRRNPGGNMPREVIVANVADLPVRTGSHGRTRDLRSKGFPFACGVPGVNMEFTWVYVPEGYATPRHRHTFDQLRYVVEGEFGVGKGFEIEEGQVGYFPEGVDYGPQHQEAGCTTLILQFPGPTLTPYITHAELHQAQRELEAAGGRFENGVFTRVTPEGRKFNMDSHKACWEHVTGTEEAFPAGRYRQPIVMLPGAYAWVPDRRIEGVEHKHLGTFGELRTGVSLTRLAPGATLPVEHREDAEIRYLLQGSVAFDGKTWQGGRSEERGTYFYLPHDREVGAFTAPEGALFYRISLPMIAEAELRQRRTNAPVKGAVAA